MTPPTKLEAVAREAVLVQYAQAQGRLDGHAALMDADGDIDTADIYRWWSSRVGAAYRSEWEESVGVDFEGLP